MAPSKRSRSNLAAQLAELDDPTPKDFDPEDIERQADAVSDSDDVSSDDQGDEFTGREHYEDVGKSKLRKSDGIDLGKDYAGSKISRDALMDEGSHDPFARAGDSSEDEDEDEDMSDLEGEEDDSEEDDSEEEDDDEDEESEGLGSDLEALEHDSEEDSEESESQSSSDEDNEPPTPKDTDPNDPRSELRRLMSHDAKTVASTISAAAKADAEKGRAVKKQRLGYDALVGVRLKMQKAVTGVNVLSELNANTEDDDEEKKAEQTQLLQSLDSEEIRKAESAALNTPLQSLWNRMAVFEDAARPYRRAVLEKWATKTRGVKAAMPSASGRGKLMATATGGSSEQGQGLGAVLDSYVAAEQKNNAPGVGNGSGSAYDDAQFYQSLLRTLIEERMAATSSTASALHNMDNASTTLPTAALSTLSLLPKTNVAGMRKDKVKRDVDTKASKGRKMRYNVHEKLQNFMAPEDRGTWGDAAREEFFASLLGRSAAGVLGEGESDREGDEEQNDEEAGLMLFRR
ncbi:vesicle-mediated transport protein Bfr2/Che-1 [Ascosphaera apis ARSEF 7405]|uniref:Protein BFR2 n=1 Tax=Ascosphaera apis ARSEF 7405 TaxID=392613 RepID=A0A167X4D4_9EURO|nr:vesicle-mediated transport protein Bfr2/Che-1 [Ascosphaera apis ARSEF 7405]